MALEKIILQLSDGAGEPTGNESVWAAAVSPGVFELRSVPFFAYDWAFGDRVRVVSTENGLLATGVAERGGHSTYRVFLSESAPKERIEERLRDLNVAGATLERASARLSAIDVPPEADIKRVYSTLEAGERDGDWTFEEAFYCSDRPS